MKNIYLDQKTFSNMSFPLQKLMELNVKTLQSMSYMKPDDLLNAKKPGDLFERNMDMLIQNTHMILNHMKDTFSIFENHWLNVTQHNEESVKNVVPQASHEAKKTVKKSTSPTKTGAKKMASGVKSSAGVKAPVKAASKAKTNVKKTIKATKPVMQHSKANVSHAKNVGHSMPKVGAVAEKSAMEDLGLLNKGTHLPN
ncbi:hypothetical protein [Legionella drancourtii]|uniref:Phasin domain-containing protein n=1 Tax=Legionella drancourtii LLAP12 TaxID=658187 RepID=G9EUI3_9GAMM|nr:hypothetical protein [Legionella drancourtii]EHL28983.1 hypothetical protein LDG_8977 [Legionella drancourtii LLAP12]